MTTDDVFPSKYLKASDLPESGEAYPVTIEKVTIEEIGQGAQKAKKPIIYFKETAAGLVCNKTNWGTITKVLNSHDSDDWIGKQINLFRKFDVEMQGEMVEAIRVSLKKAVLPVKSAGLEL